MQIRSVSKPEQHLQNLLAGSGSLSAFSFSHRAFYLDEAPTKVLLAVCDPTNAELVLSADCPEARHTLDEWSDSGCLHSLADTLAVPVLELGCAISLVPVVILKPWGREIWYTGMEVRGQSGVGTTDRSIPLPWLLEVMPGAYADGNPEAMILLKVLDPLADEVFGDLYFEMHERKQEVYVVTHVDQRAWPDGIGGIRFGFSDQLRAQYGSDQAFKDAFEQAVARYEAVRRDIDARIDTIKLGVGIDVNEPVPPSTQIAWLQQIDAKLLAQEESLRHTMESFSKVLPLKIGDVVKVPCYTPHSLQHGVRTVEFQTPVYERKILAFAQKVLTQPHWDTREALEKVVLDAEMPALDEGEEAVAGILCQQVVDFDDFAVWRLRAHKHSEMSLAKLSAYRLVMAITGGVSLRGRVLTAEQAVLCPALARPDQVLKLEKGAVALIAAPKSKIS
ncbi:hypothetical protein QWI17_07630 [Gilvimarinus sp. SDUM040013]|uniref:Uncharacterized protein n=1 Tax=Gilvimarinus gilvus TaxID=3058038 RepID=A0ABU4RWT5_9GAMM|nr:hypothetical protein [Gilvimarinus sp. SDUM040013]MDO3385704.1 hypothetical protein [Gilvimarinus sp. SDUM040013]MDX6849342.1 hypothetical protein [Gilvimarinus sp. SDUM040013]